MPQRKYRNTGQRLVRPLADDPVIDDPAPEPLAPRYSFRDLLCDVAFLSYSWTPDKGEEGCGAAMIHVRRKDGTRIDQMADTLEELADLLGSLAKKVCLVCGQLKALYEFSHSINAPDGHLPRCKVCERKRVGRYHNGARPKQKQAS